MKIRQRWSNKLISIIILFSVPHLLFGQNNGHLKGRISDENGGAISRTKVIVETVGKKLETTVNDNGEYDLELAAGIYRISTGKIPGFVPFKQDKIRIRNGRTRILDVRLKVTLDDADCVLWIAASGTVEKSSKDTKKKQSKK